MFALLVWPVIWTGRQTTPEAYDQETYHLPAIRFLIDQESNFREFPCPNLPGYHLVMATASRFVGEGRWLQWINSFFGLAVVLIVFAYATTVIELWTAFVLVLPLLCSSYLLKGSIWLMTDNAAWLMVVLALGDALTARRLTPWRCIGWGALVIGAVLVRQTHIWLVIPMAYAFLGGISEQKGAVRAQSVTAGLMSILALFLLLAAAWNLWGGPVPPAFVAIHWVHINLTSITLAMALLGFFGLFYPKPKNSLPWWGGFIGLLTALLWPTAYDIAQGRWGGTVWELARRVPTIGRRSLLFPPLAIMGGILLASWGCAITADPLRRRRAILLCVAFMSWLVVQPLNSQTFQRYAEPMVLILLIWFSAFCVFEKKPSNDKWHWLSPLLLGVMQLAVTLLSIWK